MSKAKFEGLRTVDVDELHQKYGYNTIQINQKTHLIWQIISYFKSPIILILLFASIFSIVLGQQRDAFIIVMMVIVSVCLDFVQEYRASKAAEKLASKLNKFCTVVRDSVEQEILTKELVPGDVIFLNIGDIVPADAVVLEFDSLEVNESVLSGESFPSEKKVGDTLYAGTNIATGLAYASVTTIGLKTRFGQIANQLNQPKTKNSFKRGVESFGNLIMKVTFLIIVSVVSILLFKYWYGNQVFDLSEIFQIILFAVTIAVGLTPELLPVIISLNLARGSLKMSKKGVLVKKLDAIPDFGSMDILCTDKTGTLTEDKIVLVKYLNIDGKESGEVLELGFLNSNFQTGMKNPLDQAILQFKTDIKSQLYHKIDEIPYDFNRKRLSVVLTNNNQNLIITKGQPEEIFKICTKYKLENNIQNFTESALSKSQEIYNNLSKDGYRVLAVCVKETSDVVFNVDSEAEMTFVGLLAFLDPPKSSAKVALDKMEKYGLKIKILTGDNALVTAKVCDDISIPYQGIVTGEELEKLSEIELSKVVEANHIFARVNPEQKHKIIKLLRTNGHTVGYMGDGINDTPSLQAADVGISVENAVDIAKESADIILLQKNLESLVDGIIEGRKTFGNTQKYMFMAVSSNFGNMLSMIGAAIFLPFLPMLPTQILFNNLLYDISQVGIPLDWVDEEYILEPKKWDIGFIQKFMFIFGPISSIFDMLTFYVMYSWLKLDESTFQTAWFLESLATQILVIFIIRTRLIPFVQSRPGKYLTLSALSMLGIGIFTVFSPGIAIYLNFKPLPLVAVFVMVALIALYLIMVELVKQRFYALPKPQEI